MSSADSLNGWPSLITGAGSGIGKAIAIALAKEGCSLCLIGRDEKKLEDTADECRKEGVKVIQIPIDITKKDDLIESVNKCVAELGGLRILINSAGIFSQSEDSIDKWDYCIDVNLIALMRLTKLAIPHLEKYPRSAIINISSVSGRLTGKNSSPYCASKHGVVGFTGSIFEDVRGKGVKVCSIEPGFVNTPMVESRNLDLSKMIQPEDIAKTALFVIKFPDNACPTEIYMRPQRSPYL